MMWGIKALLLIIAGLILCGGVYAQDPFDDHLKNHRVDLRTGLPVLDADVVGFTVIHGSALAEDAELALITSILERNDTLYYFPEIDCASAYYFNRYIATGDTLLLKNQIANYSRRVPQEGSIEAYEKWKRLRDISHDKDLKVFGVDVLIDYDNYIGVMLEISNPEWLGRRLVESARDNSPDKEYVKNAMRELVLLYSSETGLFYEGIKDTDLLGLLMEDLSNSFQDMKAVRRDSIIYSNYLRQDSLYRFRQHPQFIRMGVYHMTKERFDNMYPGFLAMLIGENKYAPDEIVAVLGILTDSEVLWQSTYDESGRYMGYTTKSDGFYTGSEFFNSGMLGSSALSDLTFFDLRGEQSPFDADNFSILVNRDTWKPLEGRSTLDYVDAVILIRNSAANRPIGHCHGVID